MKRELDRPHIAIAMGKTTDTILSPVRCETTARLLPCIPRHRGPRIVGRNQPTTAATIHTTIATASALSPLMS